MIATRAPLRISFGGGGTDLPAYYERFGGMVVSAAITPACHVSIVPRGGDGVVLDSRDFDLSVTVWPHRRVAIDEPLSLPRAVLSWFATRGHFPSGARIEMRADVPPGSGLGSSSAMAVGLISAIARYVGIPLSRRSIAEIACTVEIDLLRRPIGRQDQYAAALGGLNTLSFSRAGVTVSPMALSAAAERSLHDHLLLVSTRRTRDSATILTPQRVASSADGAVTARLHRLKRIAADMRVALLLGDLPTFGALLHQSWELKRGLSQGITSTEIDRWYAIARAAGAYGGKIAGAGGGGFFLFCVPPQHRLGVLADLRAEGLTPFPFAFDHDGCVTHDDAGAPLPASHFQLKGAIHDAARVGSP
jgi:D-glycero-alpha-D-manno-heptose-7-phosphate kinase